MKVAIAANAVGKSLKDCVKKYLEGKGYEMVDMSNDDIFTATMNVAKAIQGGEITRGIVVDDYAVAPFMIASEHHGARALVPARRELLQDGVRRRPPPGPHRYDEPYFIIPLCLSLWERCRAYARRRGRQTLSALAGGTIE